MILRSLCTVLRWKGERKVHSKAKCYLIRNFVPTTHIQIDWLSYALVMTYVIFFTHISHFSLSSLTHSHSEIHKLNDSYQWNDLKWCNSIENWYAQQGTWNSRILFFPSIRIGSSEESSQWPTRFESLCMGTQWYNYHYRMLLMNHVESFGSSYDEQLITIIIGWYVLNNWNSHCSLATQKIVFKINLNKFAINK